MSPALSLNKEGKEKYKNRFVYKLVSDVSCPLNRMVVCVQGTPNLLCMTVV